MLKYPLLNLKNRIFLSNIINMKKEICVGRKEEKMNVSVSIVCTFILRS